MYLAASIPLTALLLHLSLSLLSQPANATRPYLMTRAAHAAAKSALDAHVKAVNALPDLRPGSTPLYFLHPVGARVYGTVVIFHGYTQNAAGNAVQARYLFKRGFNTVSFNLAGFAQTPENWIGATLRDTSGYADARAQLKRDPSIARIIARFEAAKTPAEDQAIYASISEPLMPMLLRALSAPKFARARRALSLLNPSVLVNSGVEKRLNEALFSGHGRYTADTLFKLQLVQALPGPTHAMGYSFGGPNVIRLAAFSQKLSRTVLLAPYFGQFNNAASDDRSNFLASAGSLDLINRVPGGALGELRGITALHIFSNSARRDHVTRSVREGTQTLCVMAA
eukprot:IDg13594t1